MENHFVGATLPVELTLKNTTLDGAKLVEIRYRDPARVIHKMNPAINGDMCSISITPKRPGTYAFWIYAILADDTTIISSAVQTEVFVEGTKAWP